MEKELFIPSDQLGFDPAVLRNDFPILTQEVNQRPLIYLDNAATSQKPKQVIDAISQYYKTYNANVHRGVHFLSQEASAAFEDVRVKVKNFINAQSEQEIIYTSGTTASINLIAKSFAQTFLKEGDEILISEMEHHSNIVPWQMICEQFNTRLKVIPILDSGELNMEKFKESIHEKTKLISICYVSNSLGTVNAAEKIIDLAHQNNIPVLLDGAQAVCHQRIDVQQLDVDFFAFSGHKMMAGTGIGVLYGKKKWLSEMKPIEGGGEMIKNVSFTETTYNDLPFKFEAGTPNIEGVISLGAAIDYWNSINRSAVEQYEDYLLNYMRNQLSSIDGVRLIGTASKVSGVASFIVEGVNHLDLGMYLDTFGIAVRTGHHCTEPVMDRFNIPGTLRASILFYNTKEEIDQFISATKQGIKLLR
ncbi:MAG TPA: cysteine desulfurase [Bacteroidia bacterium]|nr:cysteine desulfurase [Bacteroidia bacterium]HNT79869.1 cysteine desulfurase [Bacteroidia bacterium]